MGIRHARARGIRKAVDNHPKLHLAPTTVDRLVDAAATGKFRALPHVVGRAIRKGDGRTGFAIARALRLAHYPGVADAVATATAAAHPRTPVPRALRDLAAAARIRDARRHRRVALQLSRAGLDEQARSELEDALRAAPAIHVPNELKSPTRREPGWNRWLGKWGPRIVTAAEIAALVLGILVGVLLLIKIVSVLLGRTRARVRVEPFSGAADEQIRAATTTAVRENFGRLNDDGGGQRPKFVSSSGESFAAVPARLIESFPKLGWIWDLVTLLGALIPTRTRRVSAELRPYDPVRGVGLTVTFGKLHGKALDEETLWEGDYGPLARDPSGSQTAYDTVALAAAAWLTFVSARYTLGRLLFPSWLNLPREWRFETFQALGTDDWRSYALFAVGADRELAQRCDVARQCYRRALARDPENRGARFNLVALDLQTASLTAPARRRALQELAVLEATSTKRSLWYRARYLETVVRLRGPESDPDRAVEAAVELCAVLLDELDRLSRHSVRGLLLSVRAPYRGRRRTNRRAFLRNLRPAALILLASAVEAAGGSDLAAAPPGALKERLQHASAQPAAAIVAEPAPAVRHRELVAAATRSTKLLPNALYVLACYHSRTAETIAAWDETEHELHTAIERDPTLGRAALIDDALARYRSHPGRQRRIEQLVAALPNA